MRKHLCYLFAALCCATGFSACSDDDDNASATGNEGSYIGKAVGNFTADEWYPGGNLGTTTSISAHCYEDNTPAVDQQGLSDRFQLGDMMASAQYTISTEPYKGWGPVASRRSCEYCHPNGYAHGQSRTNFTPEYGNGYIVSVYTPDGTDTGNSDGFSNDGEPVPQLTTFTMLQAVSPFLPPLDPSKVSIEWHEVTSMPNTGIAADATGAHAFAFPDGEGFDLRYPTANVPQDAFNEDPRPSGYAVRLLVSCNFQGLGLIDAISNDDLQKQYEDEGKYVELNPEFFDNTTKKLKDEAWVEDAYGKKFIKRFNYDLLDGCLENDGALWDELSISRSDKHWLCTTEPYAKAMSENEDVINYIMQHGADSTSYVHPYYYDGTREGISEAVYYLLAPEGVGVDQFSNKYYNFTPELSDDKYHSFMVWHRGLAVPRARNLNDAGVQRGKELFMQMGCANCHKPTWTTGDDDYGSNLALNHAQLPKYAHQTIHPYSDFIQHKLCMKNDIHGSWCRTTPLWGRGLSLVNSGREDRLHDARARNEVEAIMWHCYSPNSQAYQSAMQFYNLPKADRDAVVKFIQSI